MRNLFFVALVFVSISLAQAQDRDSAAPEENLPEQIATLIEKLDSKKFAERQTSKQALLRIGPAALGEMLEAAEEANGETKIRLNRFPARSVRFVRNPNSQPLSFRGSAACKTVGRSHQRNQGAEQTLGSGREV